MYKENFPSIEQLYCIDPLINANVTFCGSQVMNGEENTSGGHCGPRYDNVSSAWMNQNRQHNVNLNEVSNRNSIIQ